MALPFLIAGAIVAGAAWSAHNQPRATAHPVQAGGETLTAHEIYERIRFGPGTADLIEADDASVTLAGRYIERVVQLDALTAKMDAAWQGTASDTAQSAMRPLAGTLQESCLLLRLCTNALSKQTGAFLEAYNGVENVPAKLPTSNLINDVNPFTTDTDRAINNYNDKASTNVAIYKVYNGESSANSAQMPKSYPMMEAGSVPPITVQQVDGHIATWSGGHDTDGKSGSKPGIGGNAQPLTPGATDQPDHQVSAVQQLPIVDDTTHQQSWAADSATGRSGASTGYLGSGVNAPGGASPGGSVSGVGDGGVGSGRLGGGAARSGAGVGGAVGARGSVPGSGQPGVGPRAGLGGAALQGRAARTAVAPGVRGAAGPGGGGTPMSVGRSKGDEDTEHQNKYLLDPDPDILFGNDELTPPSVIGQDED